MKHAVRIILIMNLFLCLFPMWKGASYWDKANDSSLFESTFVSPVIYLETILCFFIVINNLKKFRFDKTIGFLIVYSVLSFISIFLNLGGAGYFSLFAIPLIYIALYLPLKIKSAGFYTLICFVLLIWLVAPVFHFLLSDFATQAQFLGGFTSEGEIDGFSGYSIHKNCYGYMAGLFLLSIKYCKVRKPIKTTMYLVGIFCLLISLCKSAYLAVLAVIFISIYSNKERTRFLSERGKKALLIIAIIVAILAFVKLAFFDDEDRIYLYLQFLNIIRNNLFFGTGTSTMVYDINQTGLNPAHNFIVQGLADRGLFAMLFFLLFFYSFYKSKSLKNKRFLEYMIIIGLFQPYFTITIPNYMMMVAFLLPILAEDNEAGSNNQNRSYGY